MKIFRTVVLILFLISILFSAYVYQLKTQDTKGPILTCDKKTIHTRVDTDEKKLLSYVHAEDEKDGDLSSGIFIESISGIQKNNLADITFAVSDFDKNVSRLTVKLHYTDYAQPSVTLKNDLIFPLHTDTLAIKKAFKIQSAVDGDITSRLVVDDSAVRTQKAGFYPVIIQYSDLHGFQNTIKLNAIISDNADSPVKIKLKSYLIFAKVGQEIDFADYIEEVGSGLKYSSNSEYDNSDVKISQSAVNLNKPGTYDVTYRITNGDAVIAMTRLVVVVTK